MRNRIKEFFTISSFSRRVGIAFTSIILILLFSGVTSLFELDRVSHDTEEILVASKKNVDLAGDMITALNTQNEIMILMAVEGEPIGYHREIILSILLNRCVLLGVTSIDNIKAHFGEGVTKILTNLTQRLKHPKRRQSPGRPLKSRNVPYL